MKNFLNHLYTSLSRFSKNERLFFALLLVTIIVTSFLLVRNTSKTYTSILPTPGGTLVEGIVNIPAQLNPLFATSSSEKDFTRLVFSGLLKKEGLYTYSPELAETYSLSEDGKVYTFSIKEGLFFHDGETLDTSDVMFTIKLLKDQSIESPYRIAWEGVTAEALDNQTITFTLSEPFSGFLDALTIGIIPEHVWSEVPIENIQRETTQRERAIGSGPYELKVIRKRKDKQVFVLSSFKNYTNGEPFIKKVRLSAFVESSDLLRDFSQNKIDSSYLVSSFGQENTSTATAQTPQLFGLFINKKKSMIADNANLVHVLENMINKNALIESVFAGNAHALTSSLPPEIQQEEYISRNDPEEITKDLSALGYSYNSKGLLVNKLGKQLSFTIATADSQHLVRSAEFIKATFEEFGVSVELTIYETERLAQEIIQERDFDMLLFGQTITHDTNLYAFWHSSQRNFPGLNIIDYVNPKTDTFLEKAQQEPSGAKRLGYYQEFATLTNKDALAIYLYSPHFVYTHKSNITLSPISYTSRPSDRFNNIHLWSMRSHRVWNFLIQEEN